MFEIKEEHGDTIVLLNGETLSVAMSFSFIEGRHYIDLDLSRSNSDYGIPSLLISEVFSNEVLQEFRFKLYWRDDDIEIKGFTLNNKDGLSLILLLNNDNVKWKQPWSFKEYWEELAKNLQYKNISSDFSYNILASKIIFNDINIHESIDKESYRCLLDFVEIHNQTIASLYTN